MVGTVRRVVYRFVAHHYWLQEQYVGRAEYLDHHVRGRAGPTTIARHTNTHIRTETIEEKQCASVNTEKTYSEPQNIQDNVNLYKLSDSSSTHQIVWRCTHLVAISHSKAEDYYIFLWYANKYQLHAIYNRFGVNGERSEMFFQHNPASIINRFWINCVSQLPWNPIVNIYVYTFVNRTLNFKDHNDNETKTI